MRIRSLLIAFLRVIPMLLVMGLILYLSSQPGDHLRQIHRYDKILHALAYGALAVTMLFAVQPLRKRISGIWLALAAIAFCILFGIGDEWYQSHIPRRVVDKWDILADTAGAVSVVGVWLMKSLRF